MRSLGNHLARLLGGGPVSSHRHRRSAIGCELLESRELLSTLRQDVLTLRQELSSLHAGSKVTAAEVLVVTGDVKAIAQVATKPSSSSVAALKAEVGVVIANGAITPAETVVLEKDFAAVAASANIPASLIQKTTADVQAVLTSSGITQQDVKVVLGDVKAILTDLGTLKK